MNQEKRMRIASVLLVVSLMLMIGNVVFIWYVHYHAQSQYLRADDYELSFIPPGALPVDAAHTPPEFKPFTAVIGGPLVGGERYAVVQVKGTAHFARRETQDMILPAVMMLLALRALWTTRRDAASSKSS